MLRKFRTTERVVVYYCIAYSVCIYDKLADTMLQYSCGLSMAL